MKSRHLPSFRRHSGESRNLIYWLLKIPAFAGMAVILLLAGPIQAIEFAFPLDCAPGKNCFIQNYPDESQGEGTYQDYTCGTATYPHHTGTDFRIGDYVKMREGVSVLAAADGVVLRVRDEMADISFKKADPASIKDKGCGNAVVSTHPEGWQTVYCHLKLGSVKVKAGDVVRTGQKLGEIGLSGDTEFPHLHFEPSQNGKIIDPFTAGGLRNGCGIKTDLATSLWNAKTRGELAYNPTALLAAGFADSEPKEDAALEGGYGSLKFLPKTEFIIFWAEIMGPRKDDILLMEIKAPDGNPLLTKQMSFAKNYATQFFYVGRRLQATVWQPGVYTGSIKLFHDNRQVFAETREIKIDAPTIGDIAKPSP